jgi:hypothetical protein
MPADPEDLADALAIALQFEGAEVHNPDEIMAEMGAERLGVRIGG